MQTEHAAQWHALKRRHAAESSFPTNTARYPELLRTPMLQTRDPFFRNDDPISIPPVIRDAVEMDIVEDSPSLREKVFPNAGCIVMDIPRDASVYRCL